MISLLIGVYAVGLLTVMCWLTYPHLDVRFNFNGCCRQLNAEKCVHIIVELQLRQLRRLYPLTP